MANKKIIYDIGFNVDKSGLQGVQADLQKISQLKVADLKIVDSKATKEDLNQIQDSAKKLGKALEDSLNPKLGTVNIDKFNKSLQSSGTNLGKVQQDFAKMGASGKASFRNMTAEVLTTQREIKNTSKLISSMAETLGNTIKWSIASGAVNLFTSSIRNAWNYSVSLDASLNDIRIVTEKSSDEMERFAKQANKAAKELGSATTAYTKASLIYYQQGLDEENVQARTESTIKAANVTGQSAAEVSEQLTAVWNGYKVAADEAEIYVDKLAAVAATTAVDLEELSTGMSKVASSANAMGVDIDQLSAQIATIGSVTRQDTAVVGTALKTIFARMGDLQVDGVDEFGTKLGDVSGKMRQMGIDVLDQEGNLRDMGGVIEEVAAKWGTWTDAQQQAAAVALAGKRQYNNLIALFENWDMYESALTTSQGSAGTLQKQQDIYMESLDARLQRLKTSGEEVYDAFFDSDSMKTMIDGLAAIVDGFANFTNAIGGGGNLLLGLGSIATRVFNSQIATGISNTISNLKLARDASIQNRAELELAGQIEGMNEAVAKRMLAIKATELKNEKLLTEEEKKQFDLYIKQTAEAENQLDLEKERVEEAKKYFDSFAKKSGVTVGYDAKKSTDKVFTTKKAADTLDSTALDLETKLKTRPSIKSFSTQESNINTLKSQLNEEGFKEYQGISTKDLRNKVEDLKGQKKQSEDPGNKAALEEEIKLITNLIGLRDKLNKAEKERTNTVKELNKTARDLLNTEGLSQKQRNALLKATKTYSKAAKTDVEARIKYEQAIQKALKESAASHREQAKQLRKGNEDLDAAQAKVNKLKTSYQDFLKGINTKAAIQGVTTLVSSIGSLSSAVLSFANIGKIWDDETLSDGEKFLQTITAGTAALGMLAAATKNGIEGIKQLVNAMNLQRLASVEANRAKLLENLLTELGSKEDKRATLEKIYKTFATEEEAKAIDKLGDAELEAALKTKILNASTKEASIAFKGMGISAWASLGPYLPIVIAVTVAIGILIGVVVGLTKAFEKNGDNGKKAFETASEGAKNATEEFNKVKNAYEELKKSLEEYENSQKAIKELTKGTEEWKEAIQEANAQVLELMDKYPKLAQFITTNADGQLVISEEGQEAVLEEQQIQVDRANRARMAANIAKSDAENEMNRLQGGNDALAVDKYENKADVARWVSVASAALINPLALLGLTAVKPNEEEANRRQEAYDKILNAAAEQGNAVLKSEEKIAEIIGEGNEDLAKELFEHADEIAKNSIELSANTKAIQIQQKEFGKSYLEENSQIYRDSEYQDQIAGMLSKDLTLEKGSDKYIEFLNQISADYDRKGDSAAARMGESINEEGEALFVLRAYADAMGFDAVDDHKKEIKYDKETGKVTFRKEGETEDTTLSVDAMMEYLIKEDLMEKRSSDDEIKKLNLLFNKIEKASKETFTNKKRQGDVAGALLNFYNGATADLTSLSSVGIKELEKIVNDASSTAQKLKHFGLSEDDVISLGYESGEAYIKAIQKSIDNYKDEEGEITESLFSISEESFGRLVKDEWMLSLKRGVADSLQNAFLQGGTEALYALEDLYADLGDLTQEELQKVASATEGINWNAPTAMLDFGKALAELGISLPQDAIAKFTSRIEGLSNYVISIQQNFDSLVGTVQRLAEATKDLSLGSVLKEEDYKNLVAYNEALKDYFVLTVDGYKYLGGGDNEIKKAQNALLDPKKIRNQFASAENAIKENYLDDEGNIANFDMDAIDSYAKAQELMDALGTPGFEAILAASGSSPEQIQELSNNLTSEDARKRIDEIYNKVTGNISAVSNGTFDNNLQDALTLAVNQQAKNYDELKTFKKDLDDETYAKLAKVYLAEEAEQLGINSAAWEKLTESVKSFDDQEAILDRRRLIQSYDNVNMYYAYEQAAERVNETLENLADTQDALFGKEVIENLETQIDSQKKLLDIAKDQYEVHKEEIALRKEDLEGVYGSLLEAHDISIRYDEDGGVDEATYNDIKNLLLGDELSIKEREAVEAILKDIESFNDKLFEGLNKYRQAVKESFDAMADAALEIFNQELTIAIDYRDLVNEVEKVRKRIEEAVKSPFEVFGSETTIEKYSDALNDYENTFEKFYRVQQNFTDKEAAYSDAQSAIERIAKVKDEVADLDRQISAQQSVVNNTEEFFQTDTVTRAYVLDQETRDLYDKQISIYEKLDPKGEKGTGAAVKYLTSLKNEEKEIITAVFTKNPQYEAAQSKLNSLIAERNDLIAQEDTILDSVNRAYITYNAETGEAIVNEAQFLEDAKESWSQINGIYDEAVENLTSMYESWGAAQEELMAAYDEEIEKRSNLNALYQSAAELYQLTGNKANGYASKISGLYQTVTARAKESYEIAQAQAEEALAQFEAGKAAGLSEEMMDTLEENLRVALERQTSTAREYADALQNQFSNSLTGIIDEFVAKTNELGLGLSAVQEDWSRAIAMDERFIDEVNASYAMDALARKYQKSIDETDSYSAQKKLNAAMAEQLKMLREKDKLSQYDIDRANAMYELTLKQIALEEAQNTASKMKLTRDASGNYSYQYVADQDAIADAEAELAAAQNNVYNFDKDRQKDLIDDFYQIVAEAPKAITQAYMISGEYSAKVEAYYEELLRSIQKELGISGENLEGMGGLLGGIDWEKPFGDFSSQIGATDISTMFENINEAISGEDGLAEVIGEIANPEGAFGKGVSALESTTSTLSDIAASTVDSVSIINAVMKNLPDLTKNLEEFSGVMKSLERYFGDAAEEDPYLYKISENTEAIKDAVTAAKPENNTPNFAGVFDGNANRT